MWLLLTLFQVQNNLTFLKLTNLVGGYNRNNNDPSQYLDTKKDHVL